MWGHIRDSNPSLDDSASVNAVVGVENPNERGITIGEDDPSSIIDQIGSDTEQFIITNTDEGEAEQQMFQSGALRLAMGLLFPAVSVAVLV